MLPSLDGPVGGVGKDLCQAEPRYPGDLVALQVANITEGRNLKPELARVDALHGRWWEIEVEDVVHDALVVRSLKLG